MKLVDTKDLKSLPLAECQFESGRGHHRNEKDTIGLSFKLDGLQAFDLNDLKLEAREIK